MKRLKLFPATCLLIALTQSVFTGQSALTTTFQPLYGPGSEEIAIVSVTCHHWYAHGGSSAVDLISVRNVPPTDNPEQAKEDLNLASICGVGFSTSDLGARGIPLKVTIDVTKFLIPEGFDYTPEDIIRACLECLRRCLPQKLLETPVTLKATDLNKKWVEEIVKEFNKHDRTKVFYTPGR